MRASRAFQLVSISQHALSATAALRSVPFGCLGRSLIFDTEYLSRVLEADVGEVNSFQESLVPLSRGDEQHDRGLLPVLSLQPLQVRAFLLVGETLHAQREGRVAVGALDRDGCKNGA